MGKTCSSYWEVTVLTLASPFSLHPTSPCTCEFLLLPCVSLYSPCMCKFPSPRMCKFCQPHVCESLTQPLSWPTKKLSLFSLLISGGPHKYIISSKSALLRDPSYKPQKLTKSNSGPQNGRIVVLPRSAHVQVGREPTWEGRQHLHTQGFPTNWATKPELDSMPFLSYIHHPPYSPTPRKRSFDHLHLLAQWSKC